MPAMIRNMIISIFFRKFGNLLSLTLSFASHAPNIIMPIMKIRITINFPMLCDVFVVEFYCLTAQIPCEYANDCEYEDGR